MRTNPTKTAAIIATIGGPYILAQPCRRQLGRLPLHSDNGHAA